MRVFMLVCWLMLPILIGAYHYGPGQERLRLDEAAALLDTAEQYAAGQEWAKAAGAYDEALRLLPPERLADTRRIRLERAKAQMLARQLPAAHEDLKSLVDDMNSDRGADQQVLAQARSALANSQYYLTWLMRLEGLGKDAWEPEVEAARQQYRLLAEEAESAGDVAAARKHREDLESTIRLARMDLGELQGLPLPSQ
jgi:hypothetical protein